MMKRQQVIWGTLGAVVLFVLDRLTKYFFQLRGEETWNLIPSFLSFEFTQNFGMVFGVPAPRWATVSIGVVLFVCLLYFVQREIRRGQLGSAVAAACICVGAVSNIIDRIRFGYVIDWIHVHNWSVFNLADSYITVGAIALLIQYHVYERRKKTTGTATSAS